MFTWLVVICDLTPHCTALYCTVFGQGPCEERVCVTSIIHVLSRLKLDYKIPSLSINITYEDKEQ